MVSKSCLVPGPIAGGRSRLVKWKHVTLLAFVRLPGRPPKSSDATSVSSFPGPRMWNCAPPNSVICRRNSFGGLWTLHCSALTEGVSTLQGQGLPEPPEPPCPFAFRAGPRQGYGNLPVITTFSHELSPTRCSTFWVTLLRCCVLPSVCSQECVFQTRHLENNWHATVVALRTGSSCTHEEEYPSKSALKGG